MYIVPTGYNHCCLQIVIVWKYSLVVLNNFLANYAVKTEISISCDTIETIKILLSNSCHTFKKLDKLLKSLELR